MTEERINYIPDVMSEFDCEQVSRINALKRKIKDTTMEFATCPPL